ncbi:hypothetical protein DWZ11_00345 [Megamonas rupellensis]|uniref:Uncharacterized protein n=1 Tax=Megamonas rupellensis TaxID=491921 RepID=A0A411ZZT7_9FIRM|nr:hypothetical protein [Megamonas rupellensis]RGQ08342.1 hypothetical protein DWZ11_00345 [Megamonas rupellensis]
MAEQIEENNIKVNLEADPPKEFSTKLSDLENKAKNLNRMTEKGLINESIGSSAIVRDNGQINLTASTSSQYKLNPNGQSIEQTLESNTISVRKNFSVNELIINNHKLNPDLYELTDFKTRDILPGQDVIIGNLCVYGSVLVKAWEPNLKRYVLIRRPVRIPMFSNKLNTPSINGGLNIDDPLKNTENILGKTNQGYQVNGAITDAKSLIGKEGVDRSDPASNIDNTNKDINNNKNTTNNSTSEKKEEK